MPTAAQRIQDVFLAASELRDPAGRAALLDGACAGDAALRSRVEALLLAHDHPDSLLDHPAAAPRDPDGGDTRTGGREGPADDGDAPLAFLAPPGRPDSLGRLGHYEVLEVLGRGGFGIVFRAFDETLQRVVAIKVLAPALAATSPARKRFVREARSSASVRHENVVQVHAVQEHPVPHLVMEFIPGETLQQRLDRTGPLDAAEVRHVGRQIAEGLAAAHAQGLVHRDVKPCNVLIEAGPGRRVKLTDFGLARAADDATISQSGVIAGTPLYMAPEQARGEKLDHRADLFSLGSVLYVMASGRPPFRANGTLAVLKRVAEDTPRPIPEIIPEVPPWLCALIARLHAKEPDGRLATAGEVADLLARGVAPPAGAAAVPSPPGVTPAAGTPPRGHKEALAGTVAFPPPAPAVGRAGGIPRRRSPGRWAAAVLLVLLGGLGLAEATGVSNVRGTVIRLFSPQGTLVVEVDDPDVSVRVDGEDLVITGAGAREIRLKPGTYTVEARRDGKVVRRELVGVEKNGRRVVRVSQEQTPPPVKGPPAVGGGARPIDPKQKQGHDGEGERAGDADRRAAEYVRSLGGEVAVLNGREERWLGASDPLPDGAFRLTGVKLGGDRVTDAGLAVFEDCKDLKYLQVGDAPVTDAGLAHFRGCKDLEQLNLGHDTQVTDAGVAHFQGCTNLVALNLMDTAVGDAGLAHLKGCKGLQVVSLHRTRVTDAGLAHLRGCKDLKEVSLHRTGVTDAGLAHLGGCEDLQILWLEETQVGDAGLTRLKGFTQLTQLGLGGTRVTDAGLAHLKGFTRLTLLHLGGTRVTDAGLAHLTGLDTLTVLELRQTKVTAEGARSLGKALPGCTITFDGGVTGPS